MIYLLEVEGGVYSYSPNLETVKNEAINILERRNLADKIEELESTYCSNGFSVDGLLYCYSIKEIAVDF